MKKLINTLMIVLLILPMALNAQTPVYQLPNPGFENWDGNSADDEPTNWNGFPSAECALSGLAAMGCSLATATRHEKSTDMHSGSYSCKIFATVIDNNIFGIHTTANGTITTGQIHVGSSTPDEATANYNVTKRSGSGLNQTFNGKPDSISFWTKFSCPDNSQYARMSCILHDDYDMQDPYTTTEQQNHIVGEAVKEFQQTNGAWVEYKVPFDYNHAATTSAYILLTFTTNKVPGEGSSSDFMWIDDITMIYHAELSDLRSGDATVPGFTANVLNYNIELANGDTLPVVSYTTLSPNATVTVTQPTAENPTATVVVTHGDQTKTYTIHYTFASEMDAALSDLKVNGVTVNGFNPIVTTYDVLLFDTVVPTVTATPRNPDATVSITQPTADTLVATIVVTDRDSSRTYTVNITLAVANADLSDLRVEGYGPEYLEFDPAVTEYTLFCDEHNPVPEISATAASPYATVTLVQATDWWVNYTATASVTCGELSKTYTVTFVAAGGIEESMARSFTLYPNPTNGQITIALDENVKASEAVVYNMAGQRVMTQSVNGSQFEMNLNSLQSGIYFVALRNGSQTVGIQKIVKE